MYLLHQTVRSIQQDIHSMQNNETKDWNMPSQLKLETMYGLVEM